MAVLVYTVTEKWDRGTVTWTIRHERKVVARISDNMRRGTIDSSEVTDAVREHAGPTAGTPYFLTVPSDRGRLIPRGIAVEVAA